MSGELSVEAVNEQIIHAMIGHYGRSVAGSVLKHYRYLRQHGCPPRHFWHFKGNLPNLLAALVVMVAFYQRRIEHGARRRMTYIAMKGRLWEDIAWGWETIRFWGPLHEMCREQQIEMLFAYLALLEQMEAGFGD